MNLPMALHNLHFLRPAWLLALPVLWGLVVWLMLRHSRRGDWAKLIDPELLPSLRLEAGGKLRGSAPWPWLLLAWSLAAIALAGPAWNKDESAAYRAPAAWMLVLDLSPSMTATDVSPSRYMRARYAIDDLLGAAHDARVGLIAFSDEPYTVTPLTEDVATVRGLLPSLSPEIMPSAGDKLAPALAQAETMLKQAASKDRHVIVLSDGFADPAAALPTAARLKAQGISVDVVGIGTASGAPLRDAQGNFVKDSQGQTRLARLDSDSLQQLAAAGGGRYVDLAGLPRLMASLQTTPEPNNETQAGQGITVAHWQDGGFWLLLPLLLVAAVLARRGWL